MNVTDKSSYKQFSKWKNAQLNKLDLSLKGSIDAPILDLVTDINNIDLFYTTSSCSGRITVMKEDYLLPDVLQGTNSYDQGETMDDPSKTKTKSGGWILASHEPIKTDVILEKLHDIKCCCKFKFEPFVMHIKCASLEAAYLLQKASVSCGFRNTGITFGHQGRQIMIAIRGTLSLEVPITDITGKALVSDEYIQYVNDIATQKFRENAKRTMKLHQHFKTLFLTLDVNSYLPKCKPKASRTKKSYDQTKHIVQPIAENITSSKLDEEEVTEESFISLFS